MYLSIVIPAYNEAKTISATLESVAQWCAKQSFDAEVIVVNNRSTDETGDVVRALQQKYRFIRLTDESTQGKGYAVAAGMLFATGVVRLFMDADNSTSIDQFEQMQPYLEQGYDVVIASIALPGAQVSRREPLWRVLFGKLGNLWIQLWAVPGVWDTQRGFKAFTEEAARNIFSRLTIFGWGFDVEVLAIARTMNYRIKEVPIRWTYSPQSRVNVWAYPKVLRDTVRVGINRLRGIYRKKKNDEIHTS